MGVTPKRKKPLAKRNTSGRKRAKRKNESTTPVGHGTPRVLRTRNRTSINLSALENEIEDTYGEEDDSYEPPSESEATDINFSDNTDKDSEESESETQEEKNEDTDKDSDKNSLRKSSR